MYSWARETAALVDRGEWIQGDYKVNSVHGRPMKPVYKILVLEVNEVLSNVKNIDGMHRNIRLVKATG